MGSKDSGAQFALETRVDFYHQIKGLVAKGTPDDIEKKRLVGTRMCFYLFNQSLALQLLEDDMPAPEGSALRALFIADGYEASALKGDIRDYFADASTARAREVLVNQFYSDVVEIVDRALLRYEQMTQLITSAPATSLRNQQ